MGVHDAIRELESILGAALPSDYRSWLARAEPSRPEPGFFWVVDGEWGSVVDRLYWFSEPYNARTFARDRSALKLPPDLVAIGDDGVAGTWIALGLSGRRRGAVHYVDTTDVDDGAIAGDSHVLAIGTSFTRWLASLIPEPDEA